MSSELNAVLLGRVDEVGRGFATVGEADLSVTWLSTAIFDSVYEIVQFDRTEIGNTEVGIWESGGE